MGNRSSAPELFVAMFVGLAVIGAAAIYWLARQVGLDFLTGLKVVILLLLTLVSLWFSIRLKGWQTVLLPVVGLLFVVSFLPAINFWAEGPENQMPFAHDEVVWWASWYAETTYCLIGGLVGYIASRSIDRR